MVAMCRCEPVGLVLWQQRQACRQASGAKSGASSKTPRQSERPVRNLGSESTRPSSWDRFSAGRAGALLTHIIPENAVSVTFNQQVAAPRTPRVFQIADASRQVPGID